MDKETMNRYYEEFDNHLMNDNKPSDYFNEVGNKEQLKQVYPFKLLWDLINVEQSPVHHSEGNVWIHTMLVLDNAASHRHLSKEPRVFMWSALLHDLGKATTTKIRKGKITSYDHDIEGEKLALNFLESFTADSIFINKVCKMVRWHMQTLFVVKELPFANIKLMLSEVPLDEIALLSLCDRLGRGDMTERKIKEEKENVRIFIEKCSKFQR
jgi:tRNA nucleotidyltransferase (CCA-adding enzyme)